MSDQPPKKRGRPATGKQWSHEVHLYETEEGYQRLRRLAERWRVGLSATLRRAVQEAAEREGVE